MHDFRGRWTAVTEWHRVGAGSANQLGKESEMSDTDEAYEAVERLDYLDRQESDRPGFDRRAFLTGELKA